MSDPSATAVVIDRRYLDHHTGAGHPERPERVKVLLDLFDDELADCARVAPRPASGDELALVHDPAYVEDVARTRGRDFYAFDADTPTSALSYDTALLATGGLLSLLDSIMAGSAANGFAMVRPPGHHAERARAMGFCLFNSVAVGAAYLRHRYGLERVMILDWDLHHGNGTQHMFERDPGVLFVSTHQYPYYPGTGALDEQGSGDGTGFTVNLPLPAGCGDAEYVDCFERIIEPIAQQYRPQFVLISAGFDAHFRDPLGGMELSERGYRVLAQRTLQVAAAHAGGRCAAVLEGGYDLTAMRTSAATVLACMRGTPGEPQAVGVSRIEPLIDRIRRQQADHWRL